MFGGVIFLIGPGWRIDRILLLIAGGSTVTRWRLSTSPMRRGPRGLSGTGLSRSLVCPHCAKCHANMWRWEVRAEVADLSTRDRLRRVGLDLPLPHRSSWPPYQEVGHQLYRERWAGLIAPSAARPKTGLILCLFREGVVVPGAKPIPPPRVYRYPPAPPIGMTT